MSPTPLAVPRDIHTLINRVVHREGGFINHRDDPGGATNMGITLKTLTRWRKTEVTEEDVRALKIGEATQIYFQRYWLPLHLEHIEDWWTKEYLFDWCVNAGLRPPVKAVQKFIHVKRDGVIGPTTGAALAKSKEVQGIFFPGLLCDIRIEWYIHLATLKWSRVQFLPGWFKRANDLRYTAPPYSQ